MASGSDGGNLSRSYGLEPKAGQALDRVGSLRLDEPVVIELTIGKCHLKAS
ncbi:hypothetical protein LguiA_003185 [Lonicera macranthoides]